ncbi:MAG: lysophospholipase [Gammaproteobacteria bacterium]|nr:lysophospholipase [Gammaproteobacteria bacterium]
MRHAKTEEIFISKGIECAAWLYSPADAANPPVILMAHGFSAERSFGLPAFAERFVDEGWAVFVFDYRTFGDSKGVPRNFVNPDMHNEDWDAAIAHVKTLNNIDTDRMILWGTSFSGGHVVCTAARHPEISAIIAQVPFCGPVADAEKPPFTTVIKVIYHLLMDKIKNALTGKRHYVPVVGKPGSFAIMNTPECWHGFLKLVPEDRFYANETPAAIYGLIQNYNPSALADRVLCPALVIAGEHDSLIPVAKVREMAGRIPKSTFRSLNTNHFEPYTGQAFEDNIRLQIDFLKEVLR